MWLIYVFYCTVTSPIHSVVEIFHQLMSKSKQIYIASYVAGKSVAQLSHVE